MTKQDEFNEATANAMTETGKALQRIDDVLKMQQEQIRALTEVLSTMDKAVSHLLGHCKH